MQFTPGEVNIVCSDLEASLHFYRDILGFEAAVDEYGFYHLTCSDQKFLLLPNATPIAEQPDYESVPQLSMDLYVDNLKAAYDYLKEHQVAFAIEYDEERPMFVIRDPDGIPWEVTV
jgi:catechol 2,3-dioxygenase-like lactoylglutathione lyase family enzyme